MSDEVKVYKNTEGVFAKIRSSQPSFSRAELKVAEYVLNHPEEVIYRSVTELAELCGASETTVIRFCQNLGYRGYQEFKLVLARDLVVPAENAQESVSVHDDLADIARKILYNNSQVLKDTNDVLDLEQLNQAVNTLLKAKRVHFYGTGASGFTAGDAKYKFMRIGISADAFSDAHMQSMAASLLGPGDIAVGITYSGSTKDILHALQVAKGNGATVIAITNFARAPVTRIADIVLLTASRETALRSGALNSKISQLHVLDLLFTGVAMREYDRAMETTERTSRAVADKIIRP